MSSGRYQAWREAFPGMRLAESLFGGDQFDLALRGDPLPGQLVGPCRQRVDGLIARRCSTPRGFATAPEILDWGGEIVDDVGLHPEPSATWMGSGRSPFRGLAARLVHAQPSSLQADAAGTMAGYQGFVSATNPSAYQINHDFSGTSTLGVPLLLGRPGRRSLT